jgi:hypothetical protein
MFMAGLKNKKEKSKSKMKSKKRYVPPEIKEVWNEDIGMTGVYLLEM